MGNEKQRAIKQRENQAPKLDSRHRRIFGQEQKGDQDPMSEIRNHISATIGPWARSTLWVKVSF